jgi:hypothetical protein
MSFSRSLHLLLLALAAVGAQDRGSSEWLSKKRVQCCKPFNVFYILRNINSELSKLKAFSDASVS